MKNKSLSITIGLAVTIIICIVVSFYLGADKGHRDCFMGAASFNGTFATNSGNPIYISIAKEDLTYRIFRVSNEEIYAEGNCHIDDNIAVFYKGDSSDIIGCLVFLNQKLIWINNSSDSVEVSKVSIGPMMLS